MYIINNKSCEFFGKFKKLDKAKDEVNNIINSGYIGILRINDEKTGICLYIKSSVPSKPNKKIKNKNTNTKNKKSEYIVEKVDVPLVYDTTTSKYHLSKKNKRVLRSLTLPYVGKRKIGDLTNFIKTNDFNSVDEYRKKYMELFGDDFRKYQERFWNEVLECNLDYSIYNKEAIFEYFERFIINESYYGIKNEIICLDYLKRKLKASYKQSTSKEDNEGIDGFLDDKKVQIKSSNNPNVCGKQIVYYNTDNNTIKYNYAYFGLDECGNKI